MTHDFDPGYPRRFRTLCRTYPGPEVYPVEDFRVEWGPVFHRGRLDGSARVLVLGQDPATHETITRRILVGEAGQRIQGFLAKLGIERSYVMVNTFLYSVYGQGGGERHKNDPAISAYRHRWLDRLLIGQQVEAIVALGRLADAAWQTWKAGPAGNNVEVAYQAITHPTYPESASAGGQKTKAEAMKDMLANWNHALPLLADAINHPDVVRPLRLYGATLTPDDLAPIPEDDLPAGLPAWMRDLDAWASRQTAGEAEGLDATPEEKAGAKRATIVVRVPTRHRPWVPQTTL
jgi:uracil DNA glycosylase superfamily protein